MRLAFLRAVVPLVLVLTACAHDAPRGVARSAPDSLVTATANFARLNTLRVSAVEGSTGITAEVVLPDAFRVRSSEGEIVARGTDTWLVAGTSTKLTSEPASLVMAREAIAVVRSLKDASSATFRRQEGAAAYLASVWTFTLDGRAGTVWLTTRDALPRKIELTSSSGTRKTFTYSDFNAWIAVDPPQR